MNVENSVAFVTGANRGLGRAYVEALLERGASKVYAAARNPDAVDVSDPRIVPVRLDVTDPAQVAAAAQLAGDVTLLINNAGTLATRPLIGPDAVEPLSDFAVNVYGLLAVTNAFAPVLKANDGGTLVNVLSVVSWVSLGGAAGYSASKAAAWSLTHGLRAELAEQGTLVVGVHCAYIDTDMAADVEAAKLAPADVVKSTLDGVESGEIEVIVDPFTQSVKDAQSAHPSALYAPVA